MRQVNFLPHLDEPGERSLGREIEKKVSVCMYLSVCLSLHLRLCVRVLLHRIPIASDTAKP